jgi:plasmid stabilization system protein ParE
MILELVVHETAEQDLRDAVDYFGQFDRQVAFAEALDDLFQRLQQAPFVYRAVEGELRRALLRRFRYSVFYVVEANRVVILGVQHQRRDPAGWPRP